MHPPPSVSGSEMANERTFSKRMNTLDYISWPEALTMGFVAATLIMLELHLITKLGSKKKDKNDE